MFKKIFTLSIFFLVFAFIFSTAARAEQVVLSISGNSSSSQNTIDATVNTSTTVQQSNDAQITNDVNSNSNTGGNQTSSNSGDANIQTGSVDNTTNVNNQNINVNFVESEECGCNGSTAAEISANGSDSINNLSLTFANTANISQGNSAQITNNSQTYGNTGNNQANSNNGDVTIKTGNIVSLISILNKNINFNFDPQGNNNSSINISINNNGSGSINSIVLFFGNSINYLSNNFADIDNNAVQNLNTGNNTASYDNGAVLIVTGDILSIITIGNENISGSIFKQQCCSNIVPPPGGGNPPGEDPARAQPPISGSNPSGGNGSSVGGPGQVLGAAIGNVLPATGAYWMLLMTILAITMFLAGGFLRFGSDPSPPLVYAV